MATTRRSYDHEIASAALETMPRNDGRGIARSSKDAHIHMIIIKEPISLTELNQMAQNLFGNMVKAVVDVETEALALDAELHSDLEALLLESGSKQRNLWGINLYPEVDRKSVV